MLTKAYVEEIVSDYQVRVRIPIFDKFASSQGATTTEQLSISPICTIPGGRYNYAVGDIVFVTFEDNDLGRPVILGQLYADIDNKGLASLTVDSIEVQQEAVLPEKTTIGNISSQKLRDMSQFDFYGTQSDLSQAMHEIGSWSLFMPNQSIQQAIQYLYQVSSQLGVEYDGPYYEEYINNWYACESNIDDWSKECNLITSSGGIEPSYSVGQFSSNTLYAQLYTTVDESEQTAPSSRVVTLTVDSVSPISYSAYLKKHSPQNDFCISMVFDCGEIAERNLEDDGTHYQGLISIDNVSFGIPQAFVSVVDNSTFEQIPCETFFVSRSVEDPATGDKYLSKSAPFRYLVIKLTQPLHPDNDSPNYGEYNYYISLDISLSMSVSYRIRSNQNNTQGEQGTSTSQETESGTQGGGINNNDTNNSSEESVCPECSEPLDDHNQCTNTGCPASPYYTDPSDETNENEDPGNGDDENNGNGEEGDSPEPPEE